MPTMAAALEKAGLQPSIVTVMELERERSAPGYEVAPGVRFVANFDIKSLLAGIIGSVDCRVYLEGTEYGQDDEAVRFIEAYIRANSELGSMESSVSDIRWVGVCSDSRRDTKWVGIDCRNATIAWDVTLAMRSISLWPLPIGRITCPKVESLLHRQQ